MKKKKTIAPTEQKRRKLLAEIKEEQLNKAWAPAASTIVDQIDEVLDAEA
jgi:hypothetical protein